MPPNELDAIVVGAGFAGIYQLHSLLKLGLSVKVIDGAEGVGGTWYWNRYPGAMSDTESFIYRFSWDTDDLVSYPWKDHYVKQPEVLAYLEHVVDKYNLRKYMQFNTEMESAEFDENYNKWIIHTKQGETLIARFVVTALGLLSKTNLPDYKGIDQFKGEMYHTGNFPKDWDFIEKRVGVIGCGSTGVQVITELGKPGKVKHLKCFQRSPQYSVPSGDGPVSNEYRHQINERYKDGSAFNQVFNSVVGFGFDESTISATSVPEDDRQRIFEENWAKGNGFRFMFGTFCDITYNKEANDAACNFIKEKIRGIVQDPETARKLLPDERYARRPLCDGGYYQTFNSAHVDLVHLKETPITEFTPTGIKTSDGKHHDLDVVILATGFDAVEGNYTRLRIHGRNGESLQDHWNKNNGPSSYLGVSVPNFPNWFMITGPLGAFTNIPPLIESQVEFVTLAIKTSLLAESSDTGKISGDRSNAGEQVIEARQEAEEGWRETCQNLAAGTLFTESASWIFGANVPGKKTALRFYFGGLKAYRDSLAQEGIKGYPGFRFPMPTVAT